MYNIAVLPGDGIGVEVTKEAVKVEFVFSARFILNHYRGGPAVRGAGEGGGGGVGVVDGGVAAPITRAPRLLLHLLRLLAPALK